MNNCKQVNKATGVYWDLQNVWACFITFSLMDFSIIVIDLLGYSFLMYFVKLHVFIIMIIIYSHTNIAPIYIWFIVQPCWRYRSQYML